MNVIEHSFYDSETEVLCKTGTQLRWLSWESARQEITSSFEIGVYDPCLDSIHFEVPTTWVREDYKGLLYHIQKANGNVDLLVSPGHQMYVSRKETVALRKQGWGAFSRVGASVLAEKSMTKYKRAAAGFPETLELHDPWNLSALSLFGFGQLCGFFVGDGYAGGKQASYLSFNLRKERKHVFIGDLIQVLALKAIHGSNGKVHLSLPHVRDWARENFYDIDKNKKIPDWVLLGHQEFRKGFMDGLRNSDGSGISVGSWTYSSVSPQVVESVQLLGLGLGLPVSIGTPQTQKNRCQTLHVAFVSGERYLNPVVNQSSKDDGWVEYDGAVYSAEVSTGLIVVRRNKAPLISGCFRTCNPTLQVQE